MQDSSVSFLEEEEAPDETNFQSSIDKFRSYVRLQVGLCLCLWVKTICFLSMTLLLLFASFLAFIGAEWLHIRQQPKYVGVTPRPPHAITAILRASGAVSVVVGNMGWWGALHQRYGTIFMFSTFTWISSMLEISCGSVILSYCGKIALLMHEDVVRNLKLVRDPTANELTDNFLELQQKLNCCGVYSYRDWIESPWWKTQREVNSSSVIPPSCCVYAKTERNCSAGKDPYTEVDYPELVHQVGCLKKISEYMDFLFHVTGCFAFICGAIKFFGFFVLHVFGNIILKHKQQLESKKLE